MKQIFFANLSTELKFDSRTHFIPDIIKKQQLSLQADGTHSVIKKQSNTFTQNDLLLSEIAKFEVLLKNSN